MSLDLHIHSTFSDGTMSPKDLVAYAKQKGLKAISITDHDTVDGVREGIAAGNIYGIEVISGLEISTNYRGTTLHILGYLFDVEDRRLLTALERLQHARNERNTEILSILLKDGIEITDADLARISGVGQTGRPHIAQSLIEMGVVKTMNEAFKMYLGQGAKAYVPRFGYEIEEALGIIATAGGVGVLAHPLQLQKTPIDLSVAMKELVSKGLDGIEVYYPTHSKKTKKTLEEYARKYSLVMTGGSDFHGSIRAGTTLAGGKNVTVPFELLEKLKLRAEPHYKMSL